MVLPVEAVAIISKDNSPLLVHPILSNHTLLKYNFLSHTMIDVIEERMHQKQDLYLGLLAVVEDLAVFGYCSNTSVKFLLFVTAEDKIVKDTQVKHIFKQIHDLYVK